MGSIKEKENDQIIISLLFVYKNVIEHLNNEYLYKPHEMLPEK